MAPQRRSRRTRTSASNSAGPYQSAGTGTRALCKFDEYLMGILPGHKPMNESTLNMFLSAIGATEDTRDAYLAGYDRTTEDLIQRGGVRVIGVKPQPGDPNTYSVRIPNSRLAMRMWEGGMGYYGQFCLDFYDVERKAAVNLPRGHSLHRAMVPAPPGGQGPGFFPPGLPVPMNASPLMMAGELGSWERNLGMRSFPEGEEKWSIPEGAYITLKRDGHPDFVFQMPSRPVAGAVAVAQPRMGGF